MKHALVLFLMLITAAAQAQRISELPASSNAYFFNPKTVHSASVFTVRVGLQAEAKNANSAPIYFKNEVCQVAAYVHVFSFGQIPAEHLTPGQSYVLLHVRRDYEDLNAKHIHLDLGSLYANPRVLTVDCELKASDSVAELNSALQNLFVIRP